ncbi:MAG: hypothetical protein AB8G14_03275 [Ilumatobacter sp.]
MQRRNFIATVIAVPALGLLAACGGSGDGESLESSGTLGELPPEPTTPLPTTAPTAPPDTGVPETGVTNPNVVLSFTQPGGFTTAEFAFQDPPVLIITGDGTIITGAAASQVFPGPLLPQHMMQTISPEGVTSILAAADDAGLLADVEYSSNESIADASTATLMIVADGARYVHEAYALGVGGPPGSGAQESTPQRQALLDFLTDLTGATGDMAGSGTVGAPVPYEPNGYQFRAAPIDDLSGFDPAPTVEAWPGGTGIELAEAVDCVEVSRDLIGDLFERADQLTFYSEGDIAYQVTVRPAYPGRSC